jgi:Mg-chelatase subunit ChlD
MMTDLLMTPCLPPTTGRRVAATLAIALLHWIAAFLTPALFAQARGPILRVTPDPYDFDTTMCGTTKCGTVTFRNAGDTTLRVYSIDAATAPFSSQFATPFELAPGAARTFPVCYTAPGGGSRDTQRIAYRADTRVSLSIGMLFDVSASMLSAIGAGDATTRIAAAHNAGRSFIDNILTTADIHDEAAVFQFASTTDFAVRQSWTDDRALLRAAVPDAAPGVNTCLYNAIAQTIGHVAPRRNRKVLIVLTDGADGCNQSGSTVATAIAAAQAAGVRVFTIGIGGANAGVLTQIANATGGRYFTATSMSDLVGVYRTIATLLSQNIDGALELRGRSVSPRMVIEPIALVFDSTRVGQARCLPVLIRNTGDAPLRVVGVDGLAAPFEIGALPTEPILPGASATAEICFRPDRLRLLAGTAMFRHNACGEDPVRLPLAGIGYDSLTLALRGTFGARPGSIIEIPVILLESLPAIYDVRSLTLTVAYDKTVLYPAGDVVVRDGTLSATMPGIAHSSAYGAIEASTRITIDGDVLTGDAGDTVARLAFTVLHGTALSTTVRITEATIADGNPRAGRIDSAVVVADSLCYQADRLIDASARYGGIFKSVLARRDGSAGLATYAIATAAATRMTLHDALGREVLRIVDEWLDAGQHSAPIDMSGLANGAYYLRIESGVESDLRMITVTK